MKTPIITKEDVIVVTGGILLSVVGVFAAYRYGRRVEIRELVDIATNNISPITFRNVGGKDHTIHLILM